MTKIDNCPICGELWTRFRAASGEMSYSCNSCFFIITERLAYDIEQAFVRVHFEARCESLHASRKAICWMCSEKLDLDEERRHIIQDITGKTFKLDCHAKQIWLLLDKMVGQ